MTAGGAFSGALTSDQKSAVLNLDMLFHLVTMVFREVAKKKQKKIKFSQKMLVTQYYFLYKSNRSRALVLHVTVLHVTVLHTE